MPILSEVVLLCRDRERLATRLLNSQWVAITALILEHTCLLRVHTYLISTLETNCDFLLLSF